MDWQAETITTYDDSAQRLSEFFKGFGARVLDIEHGMQLAGADDTARVIEIGCGDGRDATEIIKRVGWYEGFDPSEGLLQIARARLPDTSFVKADAISYEYPENLDVIYAFASLLHLSKEDLPKVFDKASESLRPVVSS